MSARAAKSTNAPARRRRTAAHTVLDLQFPACAGEMCGVRAALRAALDGEHIAAELRDRLVLAVDEACTNIVRHAYAHCAPGHIRLHASRRGDMLAFELRDDAPAVDPRRIKPHKLGECRVGGMGIAFIDVLMDAWQIKPAAGGKGNVLLMKKKLKSKPRKES